MKKKSLNNCLKAGILVVVVVLVVSRFFKMPDFVNGFGLGIGLGLELIGIYSINHDLSKIKNFKRKLFAR